MNRTKTEEGVYIKLKRFIRMNSSQVSIFVAVAIFNLLGDTVRDYLDPRNSRRQSSANGKKEQDK